MERDYFNDDFEDQLREKSEQFKMYPSDKVWSEIHGSLHTRKRRFVAGMSFLISAILILAGRQLLGPSANAPARTAIKTTPPPVAPPINLQAFIDNNGIASQATESKSVDRKFRAPFALEETNHPIAYLHPADIQSVASVASNGDNNRKPAVVIAMRAPAKSTASIATVDEVTELNTGQLPAAGAHHVALNNSTAVATSIETMVTHHQHMNAERLSWQLYITPSITYRKFSGVDYHNLVVPTSPITVVQFSNVNSFVDHTPSLGFEVGGALMYHLTKSISIKAGLQFNYGRYLVNAYHSTDPNQSAVTLNSYYGYIADSLTSNNPGSFAGSKNQQQLSNQYYEISVPVGIEVKLLGRNRLQLHVAGSIQPSYLLNGNSYVLSSDYDHYAKEPSAFRRWNLDGGAEMFVSYRVGSFRWQIGPQFRYQLLSTYKTSVPYRENMMQYGVKIGFTKTIW